MKNKKEHHNNFLSWVSAFCMIFFYTGMIILIFIEKYWAAAISLLISFLSFIYNRKLFGINKNDDKINTD